MRLSGSILFGVFWYGVWTLAAFGAAAVPNLIGREDVENALGGILLFTFAYWQLAPLMTLSLGVSLEMSKVSIYPVSSRTLFAAECLLRLGTGAEIVLLLGGLFVGLVTAGSPHAMALAAAFLLFGAFNVFLSAGIRNLIERLFQRRRVREIALIALIGCAVLAPGPNLEPVGSGGYQGLLSEYAGHSVLAASFRGRGQGRRRHGRVDRLGPAFRHGRGRRLFWLPPVSGRLSSRRSRRRRGRSDGRPHEGQAHRNRAAASHSWVRRPGRCAGRKGNQVSLAQSAISIAVFHGFYVRCHRLGSDHAQVARLLWRLVRGECGDLHRSLCLSPVGSGDVSQPLRF